MLPVVFLLVLGILGGAFFLFGDRLFGGDSSDEVEQRINALVQVQEEEQVKDEVEDGRSPTAKLREEFQSRFGARLEKAGKSNELAEQLVRADIKLRPSEWIVIRTGAGILLALLVWMQFGNIIPGLVVFVASQFFSKFVLRFRQKRRQAKFDKQLGDVIIALANTLKAGHSFAAAMEQVAQNSAPPSNVEFQRFTREVGLGVSLDDALAHLVERNGSEDLELMMTAVQIQRAVGGNLAEILDSIGETIRERLRIKSEIRTLTAPGRAQGWIITILPLALSGLLSLINPTYFNKMFTTTLGNIMLGIAGFSIMMGYFIIRKIVNVKV